MPKVKVPRKSTNIDMTAMCDVAFLLLSFFILTTKFKPEEALTVETPKSVSSDIVEESDVVLITLDRENKVYFSMSDDSPKREVIEEVNKAKSLGLTDAEMKNFVRGGSYVGVPFEQLKAYLQKTPEEIPTIKQPGIPVTDTLNNQLEVWMRAANEAFQGQKMVLFVKGDNNAKYPGFKGVINAFKKNDIMKFQMITSPENAPPGSEMTKLPKKTG